MFTLPAQPMTFFESLKNTFALWRETLTSVLPLSFIAGILNNLPILIQRWMSLEQDKGLVLGIVAIASIINIIPTIAVFAKIGHTAHQQPITLSQAIALSIVKFPAILGWIVICVLFVLLGVGLIYLALSHVFALLISSLIIVVLFATLIVYVLCVFPLIVFENLPIFVAVQKSFTLTKDQWWYGGCLMTIVVMVNAVLSMIAALLMGTVGNIIASCFTLPLQISMTIIFYEHLKLRANKITL